MNALRNFIACLSMLFDWSRGRPAEWVEDDACELREPPVFGFTRVEVCIGLAGIALGALSSWIWPLWWNTP